ncbi:hypothetical protein MFIFM68171_00326 [Madurella fahalii]|uniref:Metalloprotease m41 ftsh n=1 Tax=Madurella fahalii TaxID=1157608 RepID=A0ABQ0FX80_9PEZI
MDSASELERLRLALEESQRQLQAERNERKRQEERARNAEAEVSPTTLSQYLKYCHDLLFRGLEVQLDPSMSSGGSSTDVKGKYYPLFLRPWDNFIQTQRHHFDIMKNALGDKGSNPVANEDDIRPFEHLAVEGPVEDIIEALGVKARTDQALQAFNFSSISFMNHSYNISGDSVTGEYGDTGSSGVGDDREKEQRRRSPTKRPAYGNRRLCPDRRCIREDRFGTRTTAFVVEYKPAHKVRPEHLQQSLSIRDLFTEVIRRTISTKLSTDPDGRLKTDTLVAMILTQTFDYMINFGLEYSYLTAGKSLVFLRVKEDDPRTLYYTLITPDGEGDGEDEAVEEFETAVAQVASFCLSTFQSTKRTEAWVTAAQNSLRQWLIPYPEMECETSAGEETAEQASQSSDRTFDSESTTSMPLRTVGLRSRSSCNPGADHDGGRDDGEDDDGHIPRHLLTAPESSRARSKRKEAPSSDNGSPSGSGTSPATEGHTRQYCTQTCLLGLKRGWDLDDACPNVASHRTVAGGSCHPIRAAELAYLIREQLRLYRDRDCEPLEKYGKHGARGTLFKLTLAPYGYTFVGERATRGTAPDLAAGVAHALQAVLGEGVAHNDERAANLLWSEERRCVMLVDFDRASLLPLHTRFKTPSTKRKARDDDFDVFQGNTSQDKRVVSRNGSDK